MAIKPRNKLRTFTTLPDAAAFAPGHEIIYNGEVWKTDGVEWTSDTGSVSVTTSELSTVDGVGSERTVSDNYNKQVRSVGTEYREMQFVTSDPVPPDTKQITTTGQVIMTAGKVVAITLISGTVTELTLRDGLVQTYTDTNTTDNTIFTVSTLTVGERLVVPISFFFGLHATVVGTSPVIGLEISKC